MYVVTWRPLQWGHDWVVVESARRHHHLERFRRASMGPRLGSRGKALRALCGPDADPGFNGATTG